MAKQTLLWTALPNGYSTDGQSLRVTALLSPRLDAGAVGQLSSFGDFLDWPATVRNSTFVVSFGGAAASIAGNDTTSPSRVDATLGTPDSAAWAALLPGSTFVRGFAFEDLAGRQVVSFPAAGIDGLVQTLYTTLAAAAQDQLPKVADLLNDTGWRNLIDSVEANDRRFLNSDVGVRDPARQFEFFALEEFGQLPAADRDLALFQLFHTPASTPTIDGYPVPPDDPRWRAHWLGYKRSDLPKPADFEKEIDFHQIVAAMNQYPALLRRLGLAVDLIVAKGTFAPATNAELRVEVKLPPQGTPAVERAPDVSQRTRARLDASRFQPVPRSNPGQGDYRVVDGLLEMNPKVFTLLQSDVDGAGLKVMNFARTLGLMKPSVHTQVDPVTKEERQVGAPSLRNAGLQLVHIKRASMLKNTFDRQQQFNAAAAAGQAPELFAEDVVRGYRIDIWDGSTKEWRSLCKRKAHYDLNAGALFVDVPEEEGTVRLAATKSADKTSNANLLWLHEALVSWTGWSLSAPLPGKSIHHHRDADPAKDHHDEVGPAQPEVPPGIRLASTFDVFPGSLPRLRFGRRYWIRARIVDLAGNSLPVNPKDYGGEDPGRNARVYFRYDPISAPALALLKPTPTTIESPAEGESMERMAVRTFNDTPAKNTLPSTQQARRVAVPSRTTQRDAEQHGMVDQAGVVDPAFFTMLAAKDHSLPEEKLLLAGPLDKNPPVATGFAVWQQGEALPYLPEPLAVTVAARIFGHPGFDPNTIIPIPLYPGPAQWPNAAPFKIELYEKPGDLPRFDEANRTLFIPLPKAVRATLRLSIMPTLETLRLLGVWNWLTDAQRSPLQQMALNGQHWMLTPWRHIEVVHATQKPLVDPDIVKHDIDRDLGRTFARPNFVLNCGISSTSHLDLLAHWNEPTEDASAAAAGANRERNDRAFAVKISEPDGYKGQPDYHLEGKDLIRAGGIFHDLVQKKIHEFHDTRYRRIEYHFEATTKFREFLPATILTETVGSDVQPTDKNIKVSGKTLRTWIPNSAPPPAPEVLYVVPTFGWVRMDNQGTKSSWRRGGGLRVYLNRKWNESGYGEMLAVVVPSESFAGDPMTEPAAQPLKNFVTQWGNDPIWKTPFVPGVAPRPTNFPLARTAPDPTGAWLPPFAPPTESDQPPGAFLTSGRPHPGQTVSNAQTNVDVAPHDVFYDADRRLWYCDIEVDFGTTYCPFVRLALARYQPVSVPGAHLSHIVLADFMTLTPDRSLTITPTAEPKSRRVHVYGSSFTDSGAHVEAKNAPQATTPLPTGSGLIVKAPDVASSSVVEVWVERLDPSMGEDLGWKRDAKAVVTKDTTRPPRITVSQAQRERATSLVQKRQFDVLIKEGLVDKVIVTPTLWSGSVTLPDVPGEAKRYRLVIAEYEEYLIDDATPYDPIPTKKDRRVVFIEHVEITP
ncbi:MAG TPA: hypothetical protein VFP85_21330 [Vicinamibacterales bacterium]|nr:hypothetical protein [Vicinamibacterales bacterium]